MSILYEIIQEFSNYNGIEAVVLSGSSSYSSDDKLSDWDIYIYSKDGVDVDFRTKIAEKFSNEFEVNNQFFENGDEWLLKDKSKIVDIMYRRCCDIEASVDWTWHKFGACVGYSTCFIFNIKNSKILYDKNGWFKSLQDSVSGEYPEKLAENIIAKNLPLLKIKKFSSFIEQYKKAIQRNDKISENHRLTAFLASYFDVLFAKNRVLHCGEKRLLNFALDNCKVLPKNFKEDTTGLFETNEQGEQNEQNKHEIKIKILNSLADNLKEII